MITYKTEKEMTMKIRKNLLVLASTGMIVSAMPFTSMADTVPSTSQENVETVKEFIEDTSAESRDIEADTEEVEYEDGEDEYVLTEEEQRMIRMKNFSTWNDEAADFVNASIDEVQGEFKTVIVFLDSLDNLVVSKDLLNKAQAKDVNLGFYAPTIKLYVREMIESPAVTEDIDLSLERKYELGKYVVSFKDSKALPFAVRITVFKEDDEQDGSGYIYSVKGLSTGYGQDVINNDGIMSFDTITKDTYTFENKGQRFEYDSAYDESENMESEPENDIVDESTQDNEIVNETETSGMSKIKYILIGSGLISLFSLGPEVCRAFRRRR